MKAIRGLLALNDRFAESIGRVLSWSIWMTVILLGTAGWMVYDRLTRGAFDPNFTILVLILTIQTSLDSMATKLFQLSIRRRDENIENERREQDEKREQAQHDTIAALEENTDLTNKSLELQAARDETNVAVILKVIEALNSRSEDLQRALDEVERGVEKLDIRAEEIDIIGKKLSLLQGMLENRADLFRILIEKSEEMNLQLRDGRQYYTEMLAQNNARLDLIIRKLGA